MGRKAVVVNPPRCRDAVSVLPVGWVASCPLGAWSPEMPSKALMALWPPCCEGARAPRRPHGPCNRQSWSPCAPCQGLACEGTSLPMIAALGPWVTQPGPPTWTQDVGTPGPWNCEHGERVAQSLGLFILLRSGWREGGGLGWGGWPGAWVLDGTMQCGPDRCREHDSLRSSHTLHVCIAGRPSCLLVN